MSVNEPQQPPSRESETEAPRLWRTLEEWKAGTNPPEHVPPGVEQPPFGIPRREFLARVGSALGLTGVAVCSRQPLESVVPYVRQPPQVVPGVPLFFATASIFRGHARGILVESHEGRPTKVEGNPDHPASLGGTDVFAQATVLDLYDPDRSEALLHLGEVAAWPAFLQILDEAMESIRTRRGAGLRLLTGSFTSPTLLAQIRALRASLPESVWHAYDPIRPVPPDGFGPDGSRLQPVYDLRRAAVILTLDSDLLFEEPGSLRYARDFADGRRVRLRHPEMNRLYSVEPMPTITGTSADHRLPLRASEIEPFARALASRLGVAVDAGASGRRMLEEHGRWIEALASDLAQHRGAGLIAAGLSQPPAVHHLAMAMNGALDNLGTTVRMIPPQDAALLPDVQPLASLLPAMESGEAELLVILGCNPVYDAPADLEFERAMQNVRLRVHHGLHNDETARNCHWHVPALQVLEEWSDSRAYDGTATLLQPLLESSAATHSAHDLVAALLGVAAPESRQIVREHWRGRWSEVAPGQDFETGWRKALHDGFVAGTSAAPVAPALVPPPGGASEEAPPQGLELVFRPDPCVWDGLEANNIWLQEIPKPISKLTWDNAALVSTETARRLGVENEDLVELRYRGRTVEAPVWIVPGVADGCVIAHLGYGRRAGGRYAVGPGFDAYRLRTSDAPFFGSGLEIHRLGRRYPLATPQNYQGFRDRDDVLRTADVEEFRGHPAKVLAGYKGNPTSSLYPDYDYSQGYKWAMNIDITLCIGCNACTIACQAENNIPSVGKEGVAKGREMHWIRIDRYYEGEPEDPRIHHQPVPCMHCEKAPCEVVCPTGATVHSVEGLNEMIYNRCVGTRYCSNNCPYKVRRFNFLDYTSGKPESFEAQRNPEVTVRSRGVMERCSYCVQRIERTRIQSLNENRKIGPNEVVTACQGACPTRAIVFGDLNREESEVTGLAGQPHNFGMLADLDTRPRTTYLARLRNPNPALAGEKVQ